MKEQATRHGTGDTYYIADRENGVIYSITFLDSTKWLLVMVTKKIRDFFFDSAIDNYTLFNIHRKQKIVEIEW